jgi:prepilin-type N-terminal cleavage/methylation domain-containing protein
MIRRVKQGGFTLMELLIAVTLMVLAITITLFATIGTNSLIERTEQRALIVQGTRETADSLRRGLAQTSVRNIALIDDVRYPNPQNDQNFELGRVAYGANEQGFALEMKRFGSAQRDNTCQLLGRARVVKDSGGNEQFFLQPDGTQIALLVFRMNTAGLCEYSTSLYRGTLTSSAITVTNFSATIVKADYNCGTITCSVGQLRYRLGIESQSFANQRQSAIDSSGSVPILTEHKNVPPTLLGISFDPIGPVTLNPGGTQQFLVKAGYSDNSIVDVTDDAIVTAQGGSYSQATNTYTAGSTPGVYELRATYGGSSAIASVTIQGGGAEVTLVSLQLTPTSACVVSGRSLNLTVIGYYSNDTMQNLTTSAQYTVGAPANGSVNFGVYQSIIGVYTDRITARVGSVTSNESVIQVATSCGGTKREDPPIE